MDKSSNKNGEELTKFEYVSMNILNGLLSNPNWTSYRELDSDELTKKAVELTKMLLEKINEL